MDIVKEEFIKRLNLAVDASGQSQRQIALKIEVTPQALGKWLKTGNISKENLNAFSVQTGVDFEWLSLGESMPYEKRKLFGKRLKAARESRNVDIWPFGKNVDLTKDEYIELEQGNISLDADRWRFLSILLAIPLLELIGRERLTLNVTAPNLALSGSTGQIKESRPRAKEVFRRGVKIGEKTVEYAKKEAQRALVQENWTLNEFVEIPYYREAKLSAGAGTLLYDEETDSNLTFQTAWLKQMGLKLDKIVVVRCKGDSMEPRIHDGDIVLIDTDRKDIEDSMIYAINYGGEAKLKRMVKKIDGSLVIRSDNARYEDEIIPPNEDHASQLNVIGKAVWIGGML